MSQKDNLSDEEKEIARKNGFIISGKTGAGKTTLLNAIFGKEMGLVKRQAKRVTEKSTVYFYKLENGKCISIIDTPGLFDTEMITNKNIDTLHLDGITEEISKNHIQVKGIIFLVNFQEERFDAAEQSALLQYNTIFPLKRFWKNLIVIFTHHFCDPNGDDVEEMKECRDKSNGEIFESLMVKVKEVSEPINYKQLKTRYFNSYFPLNKDPKKEEKQKKRNMQNRDELEIDLNNLIESEPLFSQIEIMRIKDYKIEENGIQYLAEVEVTGYFDLNTDNKPVKEKIKVLTKEPITDNEKPAPEPQIEVQVINAKVGEDNSIHYETKMENPEKCEDSKYMKNYNGTKTGAIAGTIGGAILGGLGLVAGITSLPVLGIGAATVAVGTFVGWLFD